MKYFEQIKNWFKKNEKNKNQELLETIEKLNKEFRTLNSRMSFIIQKIDEIEKNQINLTTMAEQILFVSSGSYESEEHYFDNNSEILKQKLH